jgi:hypothetical protein
MATTTKPELFVVDGSNIATEGRTTPSLEQLNDAVLAFMETRPQATVTVVVDATFGHRIAKKEAKAFDEAVANNELVTPPAGAVGRGDAFVLAIADRAQAGVLSNDSFQEFHGEYEWLFDDGRLIGGKPVPHVGWVFVRRSPVRGPKSRQAIREAGEDAMDAKERANRRVRKKSAAGPADTPVPDRPAAEDDGEPAKQPAKEPAKRGRRGRGRTKEAEPIGPDQQATIEAAKAASAPKEHVNDLVPFLEFVEHHPLGTSCTVVVDSYSSHGAYARVDDVLVYIPLRLMDDPPPRSARSALKTGEAITTVIVGYVPDRRSIDAALPHMAGDVAVLAAAGVEPGAGTPAGEAPAKKTAARKTRAKKTTAKQSAAKKTPAKKIAAKKTAAEKTVADTAASTTPEGRPGFERAAKKAAAKASPAKKTPAKKTAARRTAAEKTPARKAPAKKTPAKETPAKETPAKETPARKTAARKTAARKTAARKTAASERE